MTFVRSLVLIGAFALSGCLEYHTTTTVRDDGSLVRTYVMRGDSASTHTWAFVVPVDSLWSWERRKTGDREWTLTARREFSSAEDLNAYQASLNHPILRSTVTVGRSFRWFTTTVTYREHFPSVNPLQTVPLTEYLAPSEVESFLRHTVDKREFATAGDSLALEDAEDRFTAWALRNEFEALYGAIRLGAASLRDPALHADSLTARHAALAAAYEALKDSGSVFDPQDFVRRKEAWLKRVKDPSIRRAADAARDSIDGVVGQLRRMHELMEDPHLSTVAMPGLLTSSNARSVNGSEATWENYLVVLYFQDYALTAESTVTHWWAVILTAVAAIAAPLGWMRARRRRT